MSSPATAMVDVTLNQLALLFLASTNGDPVVARQIAAALLVAYRPHTEAELTLSANIINFGCHATRSLMQADAADLPLSMVIRLRASAVSMHRESLRALEKLQQMQRGRGALAEQAKLEWEPKPGKPAQAVPEPSQPVAAEIEPAAEPLAAEAVQVHPAAPVSTGRYTHLSKEAIRRLSPAQQKQAYLERMAENARRRQAEQAAAQNAAAAGGSAAPE
jgi:hypothetical protein